MLDKLQRLLLWVMSLAVLLLQVVSAAPLNIKQWQTANGAEIFFVQAKELPMLDIAVAFSAGSAFDGHQAGIANLTASVLDQGTTNYNADDIAKRFDSVGAIYNASIDRDMAVFHIRTLTSAKYLNTVITTFKSILTAPGFPEQAVERTKRSTLHDLNLQQQSVSMMANNAMFSGLYGDSGYGLPVQGIQKKLSYLTPENLQLFYKRYYVAKNAIIAIVGDITEEKAKQISENLIGNLPAGQRYYIPKRYTSNNKTGTHHIYYPSKQTQVRMAEVTINRKNDDYLPLFVGAWVLGGSSGNSRLYHTIREKHGLSYAPYSYIESLAGNGPFVVSLQTRYKQADEAITLARNTIKEFIKQGPTSDELVQAKKYFNGSMPIALSTNAKILQRVLTIGFYRLPLDYNEKILSRLNQMTIHEIQTAFNRHVNIDKLFVVTVGPGGKHG